MSEERLLYADGAAPGLLVQALCRDAVTGGVNLNIHADDEMLKFFLFSQGYSLEQAVAVYLDSGRRIWQTLRQVVEWRFGLPRPGLRLLDFASGYGRVTRHIVADLPAAAVWVADIYAEGVAFQERQFGVHGLRSSTEPREFRPGVRFDCILVSSLFTHLPGARFGAWLRSLGELLAPGGLLLFSVHDLALRPDAPAPAGGIAFEPLSESGTLAADEYGTSWVSEDFVRAAVEEALGPRPIRRVRRGLANFQDLYVVLADAGAPRPGEPPPFAGLRLQRRLDGMVEHCSRCGRHGLTVSGWLADRLTGSSPRQVLARVDGALAATSSDFTPRDAQPFGTEALLMVGWRLTVELPPSADPSLATLVISALASDGEEIELYQDVVLGALLRSAQMDLATLHDRLNHEAAQRQQALAVLAASVESHRAAAAEAAQRADQLARRIDEMQASRFWKLRNQWFKLKALAGFAGGRRLQ